MSSAAYSDGAVFKTEDIDDRDRWPAGTRANRGVQSLCVSRVGYGLDNTLPRRNFISGEVGGVGYQWLGRKVSSIAFIVTFPRSFRLPGWTLGSGMCPSSYLKTR